MRRLTAKEKKGLRAIGLIIIGVLVFLFISGGLKLPFTIPGFNTISLSSADLESSSNYLSGQQFIVTVVQGGLGQRLEGTITPSQIKSKTGINVENPFKVTLDYSKQNCEYNIKRNADEGQLKKYNYQEWGCFFNPSLSDAQSKCSTGSILLYGRLSGFNAATCICLEEINFANYIGSFDSPTVVNDLQVSLKVGDNIPDSVRIQTPFGNDRGTLGNNAYVVWDKNAVTGASCPSSSSYIPIYQNNQWKIYSDAIWEDYKIARGIVESDIRTVKSGIFSNALNDYWDTIVTKSINANNKVDRVINNPRTFGILESQSSVDSSRAVIDLVQGIQNPILTFFIKASSLKIITPVATPDIISASSSCFKSGEEGKINVNIKNKGTEDGNIRIYAECPSTEFRVTERDISLNAGQSTIISIPVYATTSQTKLTGSCNIIAKSIDLQDTQSVTLCVERPPKDCSNIGEEICVGSERYICDNSFSYKFLEKCSGTCEKSGSKTECKDEGVVGDSLWDKIKSFFTGLKNKVNDLINGTLNFFDSIKLIGVGVAFLFSLLFGLEFLSEFKQLKKNKNLLWVSNIILALLIAFLVYTIFWVGIIIFLIVILGKNFVGGYIKRK